MSLKERLHTRTYLFVFTLLTILSVSSGYTAEFTQEELCYMPASLQLELFKAKKLSPVDVLKAQIAQIEKYNDKINCITYTHFDDAMAQAREAEKRYQEGTARSLEGITVGMKDEHGIKGWIVTQGSNIFKDAKLAETDPIAEKLLDAGAVLHIQTTVPEFYLHGCTWTDLWGVTRNPWNLKDSVGGSSGGSGAALAAGFCTLATGSDMGGSIRIPAAFNGLYGFKPPFGRVATSMPVVPISTSGPMARTFHDMILMYNVISGPHPTSPTTIRPNLVIPESYPSIKGMKIAYSVDAGWQEIAPDTKRHFLEAVQLLRQLGADVEEVKLNLDLDGKKLAEIFSNSALSGSMGGGIKANAHRIDEMTTYAKYFTDKAVNGDFGNETALAYENSIKDLNSKFEEQVWQKGYKVLLMPTLATSNVAADFDYTKDKIKINGKEVHPMIGWVLTPVFNILNWYPVINVPVGLNSNRMPIGMQIIANAFDDLEAFRVASAYSKSAAPLYVGDKFPDYRDTTSADTTQYRRGQFNRYQRRSR